MEYEKMSDKELEDEYMAVVELWDRSHTVFSLTDFEDIIREMVKRGN